MGNTGLSQEESTEVVLCLHSVHNVQHSPNESYYGMATNHSSDSELPVTSERPAKVTAGIDSVVSVRIFLHERGAPSINDRPVGQLSIPIREMLDIFGAGIYQTWFLLHPSSPYGSMRPHEVADQFRHALYGLPQDILASRICLTLLEATTDPGEWFREERDRIIYYDPLLISHHQHSQLARSYFDHVECSNIDETGLSKLRPEKRNSQPKGENTNLREEMGLFQQRQLEEEVVQLQNELDQITEEANRRIERGNEAIVRLKAELKQLRDVDGPRAQRERDNAATRLEGARQRNLELKERAEVRSGSALEGELETLKNDVLVLSNQKTALVNMLQEIFSAGNDTLAGAEPSAARAAAARALADMNGVGHSSATEEPSNNLLPDPSEILGGELPRPL